MKKTIVAVFIPIALGLIGYGYVHSKVQQPVKIFFSSKLDAKFNLGQSANAYSFPNILSVKTQGELFLTHQDFAQAEGLMSYSVFAVPDVSVKLNTPESFFIRKNAEVFQYSSKNNSQETTYSEWVVQNNTKWILKNLLTFFDSRTICEFKLQNLAILCRLKAEITTNNVTQTEDYKIEIHKDRLFNNELRLVVTNSKQAFAANAAQTSESSVVTFVVNFGYDKNIYAEPTIESSAMLWTELANSSINESVKQEIEINQSRQIDVSDILNGLKKDFSKNILVGHFRKNLSLILKYRFNEIQIAWSDFFNTHSEDEVKQLMSLGFELHDDKLDQRIFEIYFKSFMKNENVTKHIITTLALDKVTSNLRTQFFLRLQPDNKLINAKTSLFRVYWLLTSNYVRHVADDKTKIILLAPLIRLLTANKSNAHISAQFLLSCAGNAGSAIDSSLVERFALNNHLANTCDYLEAMRFQDPTIRINVFKRYLSDQNFINCVKPTLEMILGDSGSVPKDLANALKSTLKANAGIVNYDTELINMIENLPE